MKDWFRENVDASHVLAFGVLVMIVFLVYLGRETFKDAVMVGLGGVTGFMAKKEKSEELVNQAFSEVRKKEQEIDQLRAKHDKEVETVEDKSFDSVSTPELIDRANVRIGGRAD